ncbi:MAG: flagellar assembly protein FliW [Desulfovibrionaceae bacterium]
MAKSQEIEINTRLGRRRINMDKVIYFPRGLPGFEGMHEFTLLQIRPDAPMLVLQSMENPQVGLLVADPFSFIPHYKLKISDAEQKLLRLKNIRQVAVLVTVSIPPGKPDDTMLNLTGPILINHTARIGLQVPQAEDSGPTQVSISSLRQETSPVEPAAVEPAAPAIKVPRNS